MKVLIILVSLLVIGCVGTTNHQLKVNSLECGEKPVYAGDPCDVRNAKTLVDSEMLYDFGKTVECLTKITRARANHTKNLDRYANCLQLIIRQK